MTSLDHPAYMVLNPIHITLDKNTQIRILSPSLLGYASTTSSFYIRKHESNLPKYYSLHMNRRTTSWYNRMNCKF